jgi:hypothetical protein
VNVGRLLAVAVLAVSACSGDGDGGGAAEPGAADPEGCADVVAVEIIEDGGAFRISATVSSADTGDEKYADAWEVRSPDGSILGERVLTHPHVDEQPFTRSLGDVAIPDDVAIVTVAAHDSVVGFCGTTVDAPVPGR